MSEWSCLNDENAALRADVLIVGGGSRALLVLERLAAAIAAKPDQKLKVLVADPKPLGPGLHDPDQPSYVTFNSPNACPTIFVNGRVLNLKSEIAGSSFEQWLEANGGDLSQAFQSRATAGRYLRWSAERLLSALPRNLTVEHTPHTIVAAAKVASGFELKAEGGPSIRTRSVVLAVGHSFAEPRLEAGDLTCSRRVVANPFPLRSQLEGLGSGSTVAVRGLGLTALDVVAELTLGRGGRFETGHDGTLHYIPGGDEPQIYLYSRSSCPIRARPDGPAAGQERFEPVILTDTRAAELCGGDRPIKFRSEIFPLILAEMAHRLQDGDVSGLDTRTADRIRRWYRNGGAERESSEICAFFLAPEVYDPLLALIRPILRNGVPGTRSLAMAFLREDIHASRQGVLVSSLKRGLETLIEARIFIKRTIDFAHGRLADTSWLFRTFSGLVNRNTIGPQWRKSEELLALLDCGMVEIAPGGSSVAAADEKLRLHGPGFSNGVAVDRLVAADRLDFATPQQAGLVRSLISAGLTTPVFDEAGDLLGLKTGPDMRLMVNSCKESRIWAIGQICDGSAYYNNYLPCIQPDSEYAYFEADRIAQGILLEPDLSTPGAAA